MAPKTKKPRIMRNSVLEVSGGGGGVGKTEVVFCRVIGWVLLLLAALVAIAVSVLVVFAWYADMSNRQREKF